jgi:hypothetical protein
MYEIADLVVLVADVILTFLSADNLFPSTYHPSALFLFKNFNLIVHSVIIVGLHFSSSKLS